MASADNGATAFRILRHAWFCQVLESHPPDRHCEDDYAKKFRVDYNKKLRKQYDEDTEAILLGEKLFVAPLGSYQITQE